MQAAPEQHKEDIDRAFQLLKANDAAGAESVCRSILEKSPQHINASFLLGVAYCLKENYEQALAQLLPLQAAGYNSAQVLYNLGVAYNGLKRHDEAATAYRHALAQDPAHIFSLHNLGKLYYDFGHLPEASQHFTRVMEIDPNHGGAPNNLVLADTYLLPTHDWITHCNKLLQGTAPLSNENRYIILIHRARAEWANGDMQALGVTLWAASNIRPASTPLTKNSITYEEFLSVLLSFRKTNPGLYGPARGEIFMVGDSHALSYANTRLLTHGRNLKVLSHPIIGAKAWHIGTDRPTPYKAALSAYLKRLPSGAPLLCAFGEIDCRMETGILPHWQKTGGKLETIVKEQVSRYVAAMLAMVDASKHPLAFLSVPPPHAKTGDRREVVRLFNSALEHEAKKHGCGYIDIYSRVVGQDSYVAPPFYIDEFHLKPGALQLSMA